LAPDIHRKLQKLVAEGSRDLDHIATLVYYNRDLEKEKKDLEREKRKDKLLFKTLHQLHHLGLDNTLVLVNKIFGELN
jgi:hypothetical protein